ncbi:MAG: bifunctional lysylphosphatidylglycerol flippase/synthetase MprF [Pseudomonadota bacterium]
MSHAPSNDSISSDDSGRRHPWLMPSITLLLFSLAGFAIYRLLHEIHLDQLLEAIRALSPGAILLALLFMVASYASMVGYDAAALRYIGRRLPLRTVALASFTGYAFSNTIGMALISGASVRFRIYAEAGLDGLDVARIAAFCALAFGIGAHAVGAGALAWQPELLAEHLYMDSATLRAAGLALLALLGALLLWLALGPRYLNLWRWRLALPSFRLSLALLALSAVDIALAGACLYVLLPESNVPFIAFLLVFVAALVAGVASHVPGGLGVFEAVMLLGLHQHMPAEQLTAALLIFRGIYYLLPLMLATLVLAARETRERAEPAILLARQLGGWGARLVPPVMAGMSFIAGLILLASSATPTVPQRLLALEAALPLMVIEASSLLAAFTGLMLLVLARGLYRRLNGAFLMTVLLLVAGAVLSIAKGIDYEEALLLSGAAFILLLSRREFYRRTRLLDSTFTPGWVLSVAAAILGMMAVTFFSFKHVEYSHFLWTSFGFDQEAARALRASLAVGVGAALLGLTALLRPPRTPLALSRPDAATLALTETLIRQQAHALPNLALAGDKHLLFDDEGGAFVMFGVRGSTHVSLGDPVGPARRAEELAWRFRENVDRQGGRIAFYQVRPDYLPFYLDMGLMPIKIGEEAVVDLSRFSLEGPQGYDHRYLLKRAARDGLSFEILPACRFDDERASLREISDAWLAQRNTREKRFSVGAFDEAYLRHFNFGIVRHEGRIVAFASLLESCQDAAPAPEDARRGEMAIDLMRYRPDAPKNTMQFLLLRCLLQAQENGYARFSLGMAPLSGLEDHTLAPLWQRFGALIYNLGEPYYNFQGLRTFKQKFNPDWEPRYLATEGGMSPAIVLADIAALIAGGMRGVIGK